MCTNAQKVVASLLRTMSHTQPLQDYHHAVYMVDTALAKAMQSRRSIYNRTIRMPPGGLVFQRDMFLNIPTIGDLDSIHERRQVKINEHLRRQHIKHFDCDYQVGSQVLNY
jgi:hypothetical protein